MLDRVAGHARARDRVGAGLWSVGLAGLSAYIARDQGGRCPLVVGQPCWFVSSRARDQGGRCLLVVGQQG